ncbi:MAG: phosphoribosylanthranilate isomerase [Gemmatimonadota bacterium]
MTVEVKICGLTRSEDAARAAGAGASYLGVVFAPSPRRIDTATGKQIVKASGGVPVLGVFAGQQVSEILQICTAAGLAGAQLQGLYSTADARRLRESGILVWRVARLASEADLGWLLQLREASSAVLVEAATPQALGGTGVSLPLYLAREARANLPGHQMVLAGGLTPRTVADAISDVRPDVVDVSSGIELRPGVKDPEKMMRFMEAVVGHHTTR